MAKPGKWKSWQAANPSKRQDSASGKTQPAARPSKWQVLAIARWQIPASGRTEQAASPIKWRQMANPSKHQVTANGKPVHLGKWQILANGMSW